MKRFALLALSVSTLLVGCGDPHPSVYRVAVDETPLKSVPETCYFSGTVPSDLDQQTNAYSEQVWTLWNGESSESNYLDLPAHEYELGDLRVMFPDVTVVGGPRTWATVETDVQGTSNTREETVTITFEGEPGGTGKGTILVKATNTCTGSSSCRSCEATLPFFARRLPDDVATEQTK